METGKCQCHRDSERQETHLFLVGKTDRATSLASSTDEAAIPFGTFIPCSLINSAPCSRPGSQAFKASDLEIRRRPIKGERQDETPRGYRPGYP